MKRPASCRRRAHRCPAGAARRSIVMNCQDPQYVRVTAHFRARGVVGWLSSRAVRPATVDAALGIATKRISHDENETLHCCTCRSRICGNAICCERTDIRDGYTRQHERAPRSTGTARHIWKFRTDCRDSYRAVDRNIQPALRRCDQLGPHLEKHESSGQVVTARRPHAAGARSFCPGTAASNSRV